MARRHSHAMHLRFHRADPPNVRQRHEDAEKFLAGVDDPAGVLPEKFERLGVRCQMVDDAGDGMDDRVAATGEREVGKSHHLRAGERAAAVGGLREEAEEIVARVGCCPVELGLVVGLQARPLTPTGAVEDMDPPADPDFGFRLRQIEQHSQRPRLQGQCKTIDYLERIAGKRLAEHVVDERFDAGLECRFPGPQKKGIDELSVVGVLRGIDFDRQLPHRAEILFRGHRHAKRRIGAEGFPVLRRPPHILVAQDHEDLLAAIRTGENPVCLPFLAKGIGEIVHGVWLPRRNHRWSGSLLRGNREVASPQNCIVFAADSIWLGTTIPAGGQREPASRGEQPRLCAAGRGLE